MRVLVCGGRDYQDKNRVWDELDKIVSDFNLWDEELLLPLPTFQVVHGNARGADRWASHWCTHNYVHEMVFPANWKQHGKRAGYIRNKRMLEEGQPDLVLAFPGGKGTAMMVALAQKNHVPVKIIS